MRMHHPYRDPVVFVIGVLVVLALIVLTTPSDATEARWTPQQGVDAPSTATDCTSPGSPARRTAASGGTWSAPAEQAARWVMDAPPAPEPSAP